MVESTIKTSINPGPKKIKSPIEDWNAREKFHAFVKDTKNIELAKNINIKSENFVLIEIFYLTRPTPLFLGDEIVVDPHKSGLKKVQEFWMPIGKVLKPGIKPPRNKADIPEPLYSVGEIVKLPNALMDRRENPAHEAAIKFNETRPPEERKEVPSQWIADNMNVWRENYRFCFDPFSEPTPDDPLIMLLPIHFIETPIDLSLIK